MAGVLTFRIASQEVLLREYERELNREIIPLIKGGEDVRTEFKSSLRWDAAQGMVNKELEKAVVKSVAGFMNSAGGNVVIGVTDNGEIAVIKQDYETLKKKNSDGFEQYLLTLMSRALGTDVTASCHVLFHDVRGKDVCRVFVEPSFRPVYFGDGRDKHFYVRAERSTREMDVEEATRYIQWKWGNTG